MAYKETIDVKQFNDLIDRYNQIYEKQEILKQDKADLNKYCKALGYHPGVINKIVNRQNSLNLDKLKEQEEVFSLYLSVLNK